MQAFDSQFSQHIEPKLRDDKKRTTTATNLHRARHVCKKAKPACTAPSQQHSHSNMVEHNNRHTVFSYLADTFELYNGTFLLPQCTDLPRYKLKSASLLYVR